MFLNVMDDPFRDTVIFLLLLLGFFCLRTYSFVHTTSRPRLLSECFGAQFSRIIRLDSRINNFLFCLTVNYFIKLELGLCSLWALFLMGCFLEIFRVRNSEYDCSWKCYIEIHAPLVRVFRREIFSVNERNGPNQLNWQFR
jgi:hypothetical protein